MITTYKFDGGGKIRIEEERGKYYLYTLGGDMPHHSKARAFRDGGTLVLYREGVSSNMRVKKIRLIQYGFWNASKWEIEVE